jgi:hypothetical protein
LPRRGSRQLNNLADRDPRGGGDVDRAADHCDIERQIGPPAPADQRWSWNFGPPVKVDRLKRKPIQNDDEKEPCARVQSQGCA